MQTGSASTHVDNDTEDTNRNRNFISRTVTRLAISCALACLTLCMRLSGPAVHIQNHSARSSASDMMAKATLDQQLNCRCNACTRELIVTGLRVTHVFTNAPSSDEDADDWRWQNAVCEPFTSTEMRLLDTNDEDYIRSAFPALGSVIGEEIAARQRTGSSSLALQQRPRGLSCDVATFH
jgi:hypothetical protein